LSAFHPSKQKFNKLWCLEKKGDFFVKTLKERLIQKNEGALGVLSKTKK